MAMHEHTDAMMDGHIQSKNQQQINETLIWQWNWMKYTTKPRDTTLSCYHNSGLTRNWMVNASVYYYVLLFIFVDIAFLLGSAEHLSHFLFPAQNVIRPFALFPLINIVFASQLRLEEKTIWIT